MNKALVAALLSSVLCFVMVSCGGENRNANADKVPLEVVSASPGEDESGVPLGGSIELTFSGAIDNSSIDNSSIRITLEGRDVRGAIASNGDSAAFLPAEPLSLLAKYTCTISTGLKGVSGNSIANEYAWSFTTRDGAWSGQENVGNGTVPSAIPPDGAFPRVAVDDGGNAIAVWPQSGATQKETWANRYVPGTGWGTAQAVSSNLSGDVRLPQVAIDPSGNSTVVWMQTDGAYQNIWARRYEVGSGWGSAQAIDSSDAQAMNPQVAMDPAGNALVVWVQAGGGGVRGVWFSRYAPGAGWGAAQVLQEAGDSSAVNVAMDSHGNAIAAWNQWDGSRYNGWASRCATGGSWDPPQPVEGDDGTVSPPQVGMDESGNAVACWAQYDGSRNHVWVNHYRVEGGWGTAQRVDGGDSPDASSPQVGIGANGNAVVGWYANEGGTWTAWACTNRNGTGWGAPTRIGPAAANSSIPRVAMDAYGNALAVWMQWSGTGFDLWAARFGKDSGWGPPQLIETNGGAIASIPGIAMHRRGSAFVVWGQRDGANDRIWTNRFE